MGLEESLCAEDMAPGSLLGEKDGEEEFWAEVADEGDQGPFPLSER